MKVADMSSLKKCIGVVAIMIASGFLAGHFALGGEVAPGPGKTKERARIVLSKGLPTMNGNHLKAVPRRSITGPGESSPPHSHPCAVIAYVVVGSIRTQLNGGPNRSTRQESLSEAQNGVHQVSANASSSEPAKLVAYLICDHDAPLSVSVSQNLSQEGSTK